MEQFRHNELTFHLMVEASPSALLLVNSAGSIAYLNGFAESLFQYTKNELIGKNIEMLIPARFRGKSPALFESYMSRPVQRHTGVNKDLLAQKKDGTEFPIEIGLNPIVTVEGTLVLAAITDLTERKKTERQFQLVVESAPNAMILVNQRGEIKMANQQAEKQFGYSNNELIGAKLELLIPERFKAGHPGFRTQFMQSPETRSMGTGRDLFARRKDGTEFPAEIGLNPLEVTGERLVLASIIDITERKKHETEILISKQKAEALTQELYINNLELAKRNNDVQESINYAKKIQFSILPELSEINKSLSDVVLYYEPKNVIGGDFYWYHHQNNVSYIAVVDCTGHSVPGALMSIIVYSLLNEIVLTHSNISPGDILSTLHRQLYKYLQQEKGDEYSQDGCDIALCKVDTANKQIQFSGAHQNIYICSTNETKILKATAKSIGGLSIIGKPEPARTFKTEIFDIEEDVLVAMTTDGILDQLNANDEIFGTKRFVAMLAGGSQLPAVEVNGTVVQTINQWKQHINQQDDMLMLAFRIKA